MLVQTQLHHPLQERFQSYTGDPAYQRFLKQCCRQTNIRYAVFTLPFTCNDPLTYLKTLHTNSDFLYYREQPSENHATAAAGALLELHAKGADRFKNMQRSIDSIKDQTLHFNPVNHHGFFFLGGFSFFDDVHSDPWQPLGAASFVLPKKTIIKHNDETSLTLGFSVDKQCTPQKLHAMLQKALISFNEHAHSVPVNASFFKANGAQNEAGNGPSSAHEQWMQMITEAREWITHKGIKKVVLARELYVAGDQEHSPTAILDRLRRQYPKCSSFLIKKEHSDAFIGCSPEQLLSFRGNSIQTEALAGSIARGVDKQEDQALATELLGSKKNNQEHHYVVKAIEEALAPLVKEMERDKHPILHKLSNVQHLRTSIRAKMNEGIKPLNLLAALHPTPAVGGYPRDPALEYIKHHEHFNRGWFAGPVGWMDSAGRGEFNVAIRSGLIGKHSARLFAGCGIVTGSDPEKEWEETNLKLMPMLSALCYD